MAPEKQDFQEPEKGIMAAVPQPFSHNWQEFKSDRFDPAALWERLGEDSELLGELVDIFVAEGPAMLQHIQDALDNNDADALGKASHRLKGSVLQFSAAQASATAARLEMLGRGNTLAGASELFQELQVEVGWLIKTLKKMVASGLQ